MRTNHNVNTGYLYLYGVLLTYKLQILLIDNLVQVAQQLGLLVVRDQSHLKQQGK